MLAPQVLELSGNQITSLDAQVLAALTNLRCSWMLPLPRMVL
jgi:hypothetical protein